MSEIEMVKQPSRNTFFSFRTKRFNKYLPKKIILNEYSKYRNNMMTANTINRLLSNISTAVCFLFIKIDKYI